MKIIEQGHEILRLPADMTLLIEQAGRTCYKSEDRVTEDSAKGFVRMLRDRGHHAMLEFGMLVVKFVTNRGGSLTNWSGTDFVVLLRSLHVM